METGKREFGGQATSKEEMDLNARRSPEGAEAHPTEYIELCRTYILWLVSCKKRCTCGAFLDGSFRQQNEAIENVLLRNLELVVNVEEQLANGESSTAVKTPSNGRSENGTLNTILQEYVANAMTSAMTPRKILLYVGLKVKLRKPEKLAKRS